MIVGLNYRFQVAAVCIFAIIVIDYARRKKLSLLSTRLFNCILITAGVNLVFDIATVYTVSHLSEIPAWFNRFCHQMFLGSLDLIVYLLFCYIEVMSKNQRRFRDRSKLIVYTPIIVALISTCFADLNYYKKDEVAYSMGPMAYILYVILGIYIIFIIADTFRYRKKLPLKTIFSIRFGVGILLFVTVFQALNPGFLISCLGMTLMIFFFYLSFENPAEQIDEITESFNQKAFDNFITEQLSRKEVHIKGFFRKKSIKKFYIINIKISDYYQLYNQLGRVSIINLLKKINIYLASLRGMNSFRIHGNCFTLVSLSDFCDIATLSNRIITRFKKPWQLSDSNVMMKIKIDVLECPTYAKTLDEICSLMNYLSVSRKGTEGDEDKIHIVEEDLIKKNKRYQQIETIVSKAIENDGFEVFYQPIYSTTQGYFATAEALVRLKDKETVGFVSPEEFIPMAEKNGQIMELGAIIFKKVCQFIRRENPKQYGIDYIEVNISGIQGIDTSLPDQLKEIMSAYKVPPNFINLEITETATIESGEMLMKNMRILTSMGCSFSMDDFGTGYSNLAQMSEISYDLIKIDKSLIWPCFGEKADKSVKVLKCVVEMIQGLGGKIVAEGVETEDMVNMLTNFGVNYLQGYFYSKPINETQFIQYVSKQNKTANIAEMRKE